MRAIFVLALCLVASSSLKADDSVDFGRDVRPILESKCFSCHGSEKQKSGLRLDDKAAAMAGGDSGPAIVAGNASESDLIDRVTTEKADEKMPPKGDRLSAPQVETLRRWIDAGAKWDDAVKTTKNPRDHWAFKAPVRPSQPQVDAEGWVRNPVDRFVLERLEKEGLKPSPETDKATLLRRLSLDLIGLPPTIAELDAFLKDSSSNSYEKVIDRLLASKHYGERWGQHWLDAARYADSDGYEKDKPRYVWFYRDWVINAINRDLPYDQFLIEQLAGDQLSNATQDQIVATGFLRNSLVNEEGGIDPEQFRMEAMFDRMDAIGKGMLGLTIQCAQCHNHKYDPISQEEYYKLFAFLNNDDEPSVTVYTLDEQMRVAEIRRKIKEAEDGLRHTSPAWAERMSGWEASVRNNQPEWKILRGTFDDESTGGQKYKQLEDGSFIACGYAPTKHIGKVTVRTELTTIGAVRLELIPDSNLPANGPGRSLKGTCALTEFAIAAAPLEAPEKKDWIKITKVTSDFDPPETVLESFFDDRSGKRRVTGPVMMALDGSHETAWGIDAGPGRRNVARKAVFLPETPAKFDKGAILTISLEQYHGGWNSDDLMTNNLGRFRLSATSATNVVADPVPQSVREILAIPPDRRSSSQVAAVFSYWRTTVPEWKAANAQIESLWQAYPSGTTTLALKARSQPRTTNILKRGEFLKPVRSVSTGTPAFLPPMPSDADGSRLALAKWLVAPEAPTTARVFVNRMWQAYFGTGLISTPEDFGLQSDKPSHPELLDWLAVEFMAKGWSLKAMHKLIVTSATYRQSSKISPDLLVKDPYNRLLARGPRLRVEAETVRDIQLAASGLLNPKVGGKSVMPPAPAFVFLPPASYAPFPWIDETGPDRYRRGLYTWKRRSTPYPLLNTFDAPDASSSCVRRSRSNTPLQALMTLNETLAMEAARALGRRLLVDGGATDSDRIAFGFRLCTGRVATDSERQVLEALLKKQAQRFADGWVSPWEVSTGKLDRPTDLPPHTTPTQLATYTLLSRVLLNLDETITKE